MPLPPALAIRLATRGILTENEGNIHKTYNINIYITKFKVIRDSP